jgi:hypothetical protein
MLLCFFSFTVVLQLELGLWRWFLSAHGVGLGGHGLNVLQQLGQSMLCRLVILQACGKRVILNMFEKLAGKLRIRYRYDTGSKYIHLQ